MEEVRSGPFATRTASWTEGGRRIGLGVEGKGEAGFAGEVEGRGFGRGGCEDGPVCHVGKQGGRGLGRLGRDRVMGGGGVSFGRVAESTSRSTSFSQTFASTRKVEVYAYDLAVIARSCREHPRRT